MNNNKIPVSRWLADVLAVQCGISLVLSQLRRLRQP